MLITACAKRPSSFSSHCAWLPRPTGTPCATTSKMPPTVSPALRAASTSAFIFSCVKASTQRSGDSNGVAGNFDAESLQEQFGESAGSNAGRRFAGGGAFQDKASVMEIELLRAGKVGVAGARGD